MPRTSEDVELDELLRRLKKLKAKFPDEETGRGGAAAGGDGFPELEDSFLRRVENVQGMLKEMKEKQGDTSSVTDQIRTRRNIHNEITAIAECVHKMNELILQEKRKKAKGRGKLTDEELVRREVNISSFQTMLGTLQRQMQRGGDKKDAESALYGVPTTTLSREQLFATTTSVASGQAEAMRNANPAARAGVGSNEMVAPNGGLSGEQTAALAEIYRRDQEQDQIIEEIGEIIREAGQIAEAINETVVIQQKMLDDVEKHIDKAQDNLDTVNLKLKKTLEAKGMSWERMCMLFICVTLILGLVGVIVNFTLG